MTLRLSLCLGVLSCAVQTLDLRSRDAGDEGAALTCGDGQREDPETGACAACAPKEPHPALVCPCSWATLDGEFPTCAGTDYACTPCAGDITSCRAFDPPSGTVW